MTKVQWRLVAILIVLALSAYLIYPTFKWYRMPKTEREKLEKYKDPIIRKILNLGLDLKGGVYFMLELDADALAETLAREEKANDGISRAKKVTEAISRAKEVIRNRIDQFGVAEPRITDIGQKWIVVQLPGVKDIELAKRLIGKTALLEFKIVDNSEALSKIQDKLSEIGRDMSQYKDEETGKILPEVAELLPKGMEITPFREGGYMVVRSSAELTGAHLTDARVELNAGTIGTHVAIEFDKEGAKLFAQTTGNNVNRRLAIVLDGVIQSAPNIEERIPGGKAIIRGSFTDEQASFLKTVLKAGALPAPMNIIEERTVGPTLGEDSVKAGFKAIMLGLVLILIFMFFYYKLSGLIADIGLMFNFMIILGVMAYFHATLTLPGIAGLILSLGMAVDANVLIFERIREELRLGKTVRLCIDLGYEKALSAIVDGNVTTWIAGLFLYHFGTGPIKGFALTLMIGLASGMFTALIITRTIFDYTLAGRSVQKLSI